MELINLLPRNFTLTPLAFDQIGAARNIKKQTAIDAVCFCSRSGTRTRVSTVRGWRANRYTNRPSVGQSLKKVADPGLEPESPP